MVPGVRESVEDVFLVIEDKSPSPPWQLPLQWQYRIVRLRIRMRRGLRNGLARLKRGARFWRSSYCTWILGFIMWLWLLGRFLNPDTLHLFRDRLGSARFPLGL